MGNLLKYITYIHRQFIFQFFSMNNLYYIDEYYHEIIPALNMELYHDLIEIDLEIIRANPIDSIAWAEFKYFVLDSKTESDAFIWCTNDSLFVDYSRLKNKPEKYCKVHFILSNSYPIQGIFPDITKYIDKFIFNSFVH